MIKHTVKKGENLTKIAKQYKTTVFAITTANNIKNPNLIQVGQVLNIPEPVSKPSPEPSEPVKKYIPKDVLEKALNDIAGLESVKEVEAYLYGGK